MKQLALNAIEFRFAIGWFILFSINSLCSCVVASLTGADWETLHTQQKVLICVAVCGNWTGTIMAFLSKSAKKIESGQLPFDDTTLITKPTDTKP